MGPVDRLMTRMDGWLNVLTGRGLHGKDKRKHAVIVPPRFTWQELNDLYDASDMAARIVDRPPEEMLRERPCIRIPDDKETAEAMDAALEKLGAYAALEQALKKMRLKGGSAVLVGADDGSMRGRPDQPLRENSIKTVTHLTVLEPVECQVQTLYGDPFAPKFREGETYRITPLLAAMSPDAVRQPLVHESRLLKFMGPVASPDQVRENYGWGRSVFHRIYEVLRNFDAAFDGSSATLEDFAHSVYKLTGLAETLADEGGMETFLRRLHAMEISKSAIKGIVLDKEEDYAKSSTSVAGMAELLQEWEQRLAGAADMPLTMLMGMTPTGLGADGHSDIVYFFNRCRNAQKSVLEPVLKQLVRMLFLSADGPTGGVEPEGWTIHWPSLWQLDAKEEAERRWNVAQADALYITNGVFSPQEVADMRAGADGYSADYVQDVELRDSYEEAIGRKQENTLGEQDPVEMAKEMAKAVPPAAPGKPGAPGQPPKKKPKKE
jgi:phage-related protein (TIGR01555 family)